MIVQHSPPRLSLKLIVLLLLAHTAACGRVYYSTMERFGYHKRDILKSRVEEASETQSEAKRQFQSALARFSSVVRFDGGKLQDKYETLQAEFDASRAVADKLRKRIDDVEDVAAALFREWKGELDSYSSQKLRRNSEKSLNETKRRYRPMITAMRRVERRMNPVLEAFEDQVLYLKHNLNARAIASLQGEFRAVESDIAALIVEMETSIGEAEAFIAALQQG